MRMKCGFILLHRHWSKIETVKTPGFLFLRQCFQKMNPGMFKKKKREPY